MKQLLVIREYILKFYQKNTLILKPLFRFCLAFLTLWSINQIAGYNPDLNHWYVMLVLSMVCAVFTTGVMMFLSVVYLVIQVFYVSNVLAVMLAVFFAIAYFVYIRFVPKHGFAILAVPVLYALHIPYLLPLLLAIIGTPFYIIPMSCGIFIFFTLQNITTVIGTATEDSILLYNQTIQMIFSNKEMFLTILIFSAVLIIVFYMRKLQINYAFELSIFTGAMICVILFIVAKVTVDITVSVEQMILGSLVSVLIAWLCQFFKLVVNYSAVEYLQFEDDEYYYYVKAVPKVNIMLEDKKIKRFNAHLFSDSRKKADMTEESMEKEILQELEEEDALENSAEDEK